MKFRTHNTILLIALFFLLSCTEEKESSEYYIEIPVAKVQQAKTSDFISDFKAVKLEFTDNSMLHSVRKIIRHNNLLYILDTFGAKCVLVYDMSGKFIRKIGSYGRGPGQFTLPQDFLIDKNTNEIEIIANRKISYFSLEGEYLRQLNLGFSGINFRKIVKEYFIAIIGPEDYKVVCTDENGKIKKRFLPTNNYYESGVAFNCFMPQKSDELLFRPRDRDTIYSVSSSSAVPHTIVDFGDYKLRLNEFLKLDRSQKAKYYKGGANEDQCIINNYLENSHHIQVVYNMSGLYYYYIQNKFTGNFVHFKKNDLNDDIIGERDSWGLTGADDEYFYYVIEPYRFKSTKELRSFFEKFTDDEEYIQEMIHETSNPIILFAKYRV
ncbi:6-bladed beta-propeller [Maribellus sediminis]|uniref:6-bladed beta-propeller n=1 Tax=Maribellus sediminis TaxID=2696285 RepID=UPI00142FCCBB|nr:6-bladed beta-propeller [Maribellus sediminis]